jgi:hypothetical protein
MEFIEAPAFTRHISDYLDADEYQSLQNALAGQMRDVEKGAEAVCGLSTFTFCPIIRSG